MDLKILPLIDLFCLQSILPNTSYFVGIFRDKSVENYCSSCLSETNCSHTTNRLTDNVTWLKQLDNKPTVTNPTTDTISNGSLEVKATDPWRVMQKSKCIIKRVGIEKYDVICKNACNPFQMLRHFLTFKIPPPNSCVFSVHACFMSRWKGTPASQVMVCG